MAPPPPPPPPISLPPGTRALLYQRQHLLQYLPNHLLYPELASLRASSRVSHNNTTTPLRIAPPQSPSLNTPTIAANLTAASASNLNTNCASFPSRSPTTLIKATSKHQQLLQRSRSNLKSPPPPVTQSPMDTSPLHNSHHQFVLRHQNIKRPAHVVETPSTLMSGTGTGTGIGTSASTTTAAVKPPSSKRPRFPQPKLPPDSQLGCRDFFDAKDQDIRVLFAMMMGVDTSIMMQPHDKNKFLLPHFDPDRPPFSSSKKNRPTNVILAEELLRRAKQAKTSKTLPRPSQWDKEKIVASLQNQYPPQLTQDDMNFLADECYSFYKISSKGEWADDTTWFRLYHAIVVLKDQFKTRGLSIAGGVVVDDTWDQVGVQFMKQDWVPTSIVLPELGLEKSVALKLTLMEAPTSNELARRFKDVKKKLQELVPKQQTSMGTSNVRHAQHCFKYPDVPLHYFYLWELAQKNGILESCIQNVGDRREGDKNTMFATSPSVSSSAHDDYYASGDELPTAISTTTTNAIPENSGIGDQTMNAGELNTATSNTSSIVVEETDAQFLKSQQLYLEQLELYNTVENEWQGLEEKCLAAEDGELKDLYREFAKRKQDSLSVIRNQLEMIGNFCDSQRQTQS